MPKKSQAKSTKSRPAKSAARTTKPASDAEAKKDREDVKDKMSRLQKERDALDNKLKSLAGWRRKFQAAQNSVATATANFEKADAARKEAKAAVDIAMAKEHELVSKFVHGEQLLPYDDTEAGASNGVKWTVAVVAATGSDFGSKEPISSLSAKSIKKIAGSEIFDAAKGRDEPIGLSDKQIETLIAAEIKTIGDLEKMMREDEWWHKKLTGFGEKNVTRLVDTLLAFRQVYPVPSESDPAPPATGKPVDPPKPEVPQAQQWEQSAYHLRELIAECNALLEKDIPDDGKQFCRSVAMDAEEMLKGVEEKKHVTDDQKTAIENWTNAVAKWRK